MTLIRTFRCHTDIGPLCIVLVSAYGLRIRVRRWAQKQTETVGLVQSSDIIHHDVWPRWSGTPIPSTPNFFLLGFRQFSWPGRTGVGGTCPPVPPAWLRDWNYVILINQTCYNWSHHWIYTHKAPRAPRNTTYKPCYSTLHHFMGSTSNNGHGK